MPKIETKTTILLLILALSEITLQSFHLRSEISYLWMRNPAITKPKSSSILPVTNYDQALIQVNETRVVDALGQKLTGKLGLTISLSNSEFFGQIAILRISCSQAPIKDRIYQTHYNCPEASLQVVKAGRSYSSTLKFSKTTLKDTQNHTITSLSSLSKGFILTGYTQPGGATIDTYSFKFIKKDSIEGRLDSLTDQFEMQAKPSPRLLLGVLVVSFLIVSLLRAQNYKDFRRVPLNGLLSTAVSYLCLLPIIYRGIVVDWGAASGSVCFYLPLMFLIPLLIGSLALEARKSRAKSHTNLKGGAYIIWAMLIVQVFGAIFNANMCLYALSANYVIIAYENYLSSKNRENFSLAMSLNTILLLFATRLISDEAFYRKSLLYLYTAGRDVEAVFALGLGAGILCFAFMLGIKDLKNSLSWKNALEIQGDLREGFFDDDGEFGYLGPRVEVDELERSGAEQSQGLIDISVEGGVDRSMDPLDLS